MLPPKTRFRLAASAAKLAAATGALPPVRCHLCAATATLLLPTPTPPPSCQRHQRHALAKLPPPPPSWTLPPRFRHHRLPLCFHCYRRRCHRRRFRVFS